MIEIILWTLMFLSYMFCAMSVAFSMLMDRRPPVIIVNGRDPKKPVGPRGAILHGLFWPIVFTIRLLTKEKNNER